MQLANLAMWSALFLSLAIGMAMLLGGYQERSMFGVHKFYWGILKMILALTVVLLATILDEPLLAVMGVIGVPIGALVAKIGYPLGER
ncbi:MAG: hypothetical protein M3220_21385 [Chloroflexota bacterium]|nr:hypothetical protein [Chloroflexota bacterium]